jgi:hypothetical protein
VAGTDDLAGREHVLRRVRRKQLARRLHADADHDQVGRQLEAVREANPGQPRVEQDVDPVCARAFREHQPRPRPEDARKWRRSRLDDRHVDLHRRGGGRNLGPHEPTTDDHQARASAITSEMELAAAKTLAAVVEPEHLEPDYVIPSVFDRRVAPVVADAVARAAEASGVARRARR